MVFPLVMYGHESWTMKKAECQEIDAFKLWCWKRLLRVPWTAGGDEMINGITHSMDMSLNKLRGIVKDREDWSAALHGVAKSQT